MLTVRKVLDGAVDVIHKEIVIAMFLQGEEGQWLTVYREICARIDNKINQSSNIQCCETPDFSRPPDAFVDYMRR